ncbi:NYN domain-containing protein [Campylobacter majalis]|nr:NYN domain-containing protein [Campylobacter majalis]
MLRVENMAVLIDAENFSHTLVSEAISRLDELGYVRKILAYGDYSTDNLKAYKQICFKHNITPMQVFTQTIGKNSADIALVIDAMDILKSGDYDALAIVSNDSDFIRLSSRIKDSRIKSIGVSSRFRNTAVFDHFIYLEPKAKQIAVDAEILDEAVQLKQGFVKKFLGLYSKFLIPKQLQPKREQDELDKVFKKICELYKPDADGYYNCGLFGNVLKQEFKDLDLKQIGYSNKLKELFSKLCDDGRVELVSYGTTMKFKIKA